MVKIYFIRDENDIKEHIIYKIKWEELQIQKTILTGESSLLWNEW